MLRRYLYAGAVGNGAPSHSDHSLTDASFRANRLDGDYYIVFLRRTQEAIGKFIDENDVLRVDGGLHGGSLGVTDGEEVPIDGVVS